MRDGHGVRTADAKVSCRIDLAPDSGRLAVAPADPNGTIKVDRSDPLSWQAI